MTLLMPELPLFMFDAPVLMLRWVGSFKLNVSFAEYSLFYRALLQKRLTILRSLLVIAAPLCWCLMCQCWDSMCFSFDICSRVSISLSVSIWIVSLDNVCVDVWCVCVDVWCAFFWYSMSCVYLSVCIYLSRVSWQCLCWCVMMCGVSVLMCRVPLLIFDVLQQCAVCFSVDVRHLMWSLLIVDTSSKSSSMSFSLHNPYVSLSIFYVVLCSYVTC